MNAPDTISLLVHGKLFRDALKISHLFNLPVDPILEGLTDTCIECDQSEDRSAHWTWLSENGLVRDTCEGAGWWSLLNQILEEEEPTNASVLHRSVALILLRQGHAAPAWFLDSYKVS